MQGRLALCVFWALILAGAPAGAQSHPSLVFDDITLVPCYQHRTESPCLEWEADIQDAADSTGDSYQSGIAIQALHAALYYQISGDAAYAQTAKAALQALDPLWSSWPTTMMRPEGFRAISLMGFAFAYDWIQPTLTADEDRDIRNLLARLADQVYTEILGMPGYISFSDWHGQAYPIMGIASQALSDFTDPDDLVSSTPADWLAVATDDLFVLDSKHTLASELGVGLMRFQVDEEGKDKTGAYKVYTIDDLVWWAQVYSHVMGRNMFDDYPLARQALTSELWETLPNRYTGNFITNGNTMWDHPRAILNLLSEQERAEVASYLLAMEETDLPGLQTYLTHIYCSGQVPVAATYIFYDEFPPVTPADPPGLSHLRRGSVLQVMRASWDKESDWLSLITVRDERQEPNDLNDRASHHDQMSFEYYSRGDLLLADGGEPKHVDRTVTYDGVFEVHHNTVALEDPRAPFGASAWAGSAARGAFKALFRSGYEMDTPAEVTDIVETPWVEAVAAAASITNVVGDDFRDSVEISPPVSHERVVLFPEKAYFIVVDRLESASPWVYRTLLRPTSLGITQTTGTSAAEIGHVNGALTLDGSTFEWLPLTYMQEQATGITTSSLGWTTTNPYGEEVTLDLFSVPASEVVVLKQVGRIAGYSQASEVFSPTVSWRAAEAERLYRVTALIARHPDEVVRSVEEISVAGEGSAIRVGGPEGDDIVYSGNGSASFGEAATDAQTLWLRGVAEPVEYLFLTGSTLSWGGTELVTVALPDGGGSATADHVALRHAGIVTTLVAGTDEAVEVTLHGMSEPEYEVQRDGVDFTDFTLTGDLLVIQVPAGESSFTIVPGGMPPDGDPVADDVPDAVDVDPGGEGIETDAGGDGSQADVGTAEGGCGCSIAG